MGCFTNTIHSNTYSQKNVSSLKISTFSDEIFHRYRLIKFVPKFSPLAPIFQITNSDENYVSSLNVIIFFIISNEIHISLLNLYFRDEKYFLTNFCH